MADSPYKDRFPNLASIETKTFRLGLKGYNVSDVDAFLSLIVREVAELEAALEEAQRELTRLKAQTGG